MLVSPVETTTQMKARLDAVVEQSQQIILGKEHKIRLSLACMLSRGHLLIEDLPGLGKTTLAHVLAKSIGLEYNRIQFTSDMLPADIVGVSIFNRDNNNFSFHPGPIFAQVVLADEINRATAKAQSALLEAMEERQVSVEGDTRPVPVPFFVIATQNPANQIGTFPLPESQLDRFLLRIEMGYPDNESERELLKGRSRREILKELQPVMSAEQLLEIQNTIQEVHASDQLLDYVQAILDFSRNSGLFLSGLSPRAGLALLQCAKAWAFMEGRDYVIPEDIQAIIPALVPHRLLFADSGTTHGYQNAAAAILDIAIP